MKAARWIRCVVTAVILAAAGCSDPETIRVLDEPRPAIPSPREIPPEQKQYRTLAAMVPAASAVSDTEPRWWFLKMSGPTAVIAKYEADFDRLLASVYAAGGETNPITWDLPSGWKRDEGGAMRMRFATLKAPGGDAEVAVSQAGGLVLSNAQRWWAQLWGEDKRSEITPRNLDSVVRQQAVKGRLVFRVDMFGPNNPNAKGPAMKNPHGGQ